MGNGRRRHPRWIASLASLLLVGCAARYEVAFDANEDFARFRTWSWRETAAAQVDSAPGAARALAARTASSIEQVLERRGFVHDPHAPDFTVAFQLTLEARLEKVAVPSAPYFLSSKDHTPSYWIEGTDVVEKRVDDFRLAVDVALRDGRVVWKGAVQERLEPTQAPPVDQAVEELLLRLPPPSSAPSPDEDPPRLAQLQN